MKSLNLESFEKQKRGHPRPNRTLICAKVKMNFASQKDHICTSMFLQLHWSKKKLLHKVQVSRPKARCCSARMEHGQSQPAQAHP